MRAKNDGGCPHCKEERNALRVGAGFLPSPVSETSYFRKVQGRELVPIKLDMELNAEQIGRNVMRGSFLKVRSKYAVLKDNGPAQSSRGRLTKSASNRWCHLMNFMMK